MSTRQGPAQLIARPVGVGEHRLDLGILCHWVPVFPQSAALVLGTLSRSDTGVHFCIQVFRGQINRRVLDLSRAGIYILLGIYK